MRNKSEVVPVRPPKMHRREVAKVLADLTVGCRFRVWHLEFGFFTEKVINGKDVLWFRDIELDEEDADAVREGRPMDFQLSAWPRHDGVGGVVLAHNGKKSTFVFDAQGIHHIQILP